MTEATNPKLYIPTLACEVCSSSKEASGTKITMFTFTKYDE